MRQANPNDNLYGLAAEFDGKDSLMEAANRAREQGYRKMDAFSPYAIEGMAAALGRKPSPLPLIVFFGGFGGAAAGYFMEWYASVKGFPLNIGGRPWHSWPSFIPITFELGVLCASFSALFGMLALSGLPRLYHPVFNVPEFHLATRDKFFLCIEAADPRFNPVETRAFLESLHPRGVFDVAE